MEKKGNDGKGDNPSREQISKLKDNYLTTQEGIEDFISELEQEAERRGLEKALGFIIREGNINWAKDKIVESIKLLEEGKMEKKN